MRLCVDIRLPNHALQRVRHIIIPNVDDLIHAINGANVFSKLDLRSGYHQLHLADISQHLPHIKVYGDTPDLILELIQPVKYSRM